MIHWLKSLFSLEHGSDQQYYSARKDPGEHGAPPTPTPPQPTLQPPPAPISSTTPKATPPATPQKPAEQSLVYRRTGHGQIWTVASIAARAAAELNSERRLRFIIILAVFIFALIDSFFN